MSFPSKPENCSALAFISHFTEWKAFPWQCASYLGKANTAIWWCHVNGKLQPRWGEEKRWNQTTYDVEYSIKRATYFQSAKLNCIDLMLTIDPTLTNKK